jgi:hypothetical protein
LLALLPRCIALWRYSVALELSRKVSRTQLNMRSGYAAMTIVKQDCEKEKV